MTKLTQTIATKDWREKRIPEVMKAFHDLSEAATKDGKLSKKYKEIIATIVSGMMRCPHCTENHLKKALAAGASKDEIAEAVGVAMYLGGITQSVWTETFAKYLE